MSGRNSCRLATSSRRQGSGARDRGRWTCLWREVWRSSCKRAAWGKGLGGMPSFEAFSTFHLSLKPQINSTEKKKSIIVDNSLQLQQLNYPALAFCSFYSTPFSLLRVSFRTNLPDPWLKFTLWLIYLSISLFYFPCFKFSVTIALFFILPFLISCVLLQRYPLLRLICLNVAFMIDQA